MTITNKCIKCGASDSLEFDSLNNHTKCNACGIEYSNETINNKIYNQLINAVDTRQLGDFDKSRRLFITALNENFAMFSLDKITPLVKETNAENVIKSLNELSVSDRECMANIFWNLFLCDQKIVFRNPSDNKNIRFPNFYKVVNSNDSETYYKMIDLIYQSTGTFNPYENDYKLINSKKETYKYITETEDKYDIFISFKTENQYGDKEFKYAEALYDILTKRRWKLWKKLELTLWKNTL